MSIVAKDLLSIVAKDLMYDLEELLSNTLQNKGKIFIELYKYKLKGKMEVYDKLKCDNVLTEKEYETILNTCSKIAHHLELKNIRR